MWRYLVGAVSAMLMMGAGLLFMQGRAQTDIAVPPPPEPRPASVAATPSALPPPPKASEKTREEKRFDRYDKDHDEAITRDELLKSRRKAFAKLDKNGDGKLDFREWAHATYDKFDKADADKSGRLSRAEFATTRRKTKPKKPACACAED